MPLSSPASRPAAELSIGQLLDLFEHAPCGYVIADPSGRIIRANTSLATWLGRTTDEFVGMRFSELLPIAGKIYYETHVAPLLRMQGHLSEIALDLLDGEGMAHPMLVNAVEIRDAQGRPASIRLSIFNARDRRRYETELLAAREAARAVSEAMQRLNASLETRIAEGVEQRLRLEEQLRQSQKMEAIGQLTGGVAHDFNNLLTVIMGGLETIDKQVRKLTPGDARDRIIRARDMAALGAQRAANLTARLLAFSRRQPLDPRPLDVARLLREVSELLRRTLGETIVLEAVEHGGLWNALVDAGELSNALVNLAVNARDAMPHGGRLTIETSNIFLDESYLATVDEPIPPGQYVLVAVSDTGVGMDRATLSRVFEPFFTTKEAGKGTGLGLSQVYGFIRQTGGHVRVYSEVGQGTTVKLYLPRAREEAAEVGTAEQQAFPLRGTETVLICEDQPELRSFSAEALRELGYAVIEAKDGHEALGKLGEYPQIDLLFTDVVLPNAMNGRQLADIATQLVPSLRVLFTTGYTRNAIVHQGRLDPDVSLLSKPYTVDLLARKVRSVLDAHHAPLA
ncbi:MAG: ATP-binding protein [Devosia sp.]